MMHSQGSLVEKWDREADVVVVGYGAAGASTAITAHDAGAEVLILEKAPEGEEGGNSRVAGQGWFTPDPVDKAVTYFNALSGPYTVPKDMVRAWAEEMNRNNDWVRGLGGNPLPRQPLGAEFPDLPGSDCVCTYLLDGQPGLGYEKLWKLLKSSVDKRKIAVLCATPAKELIENHQTREIVGVRAQREGRVVTVKAKRAVVLTCGGFENNQEMVRDYLTNLPYCYPLGSPHNTGDGIKMAMAVGADLWHMSNIAAPWYSLKVPEYPAIMEMVPLHYAKEFSGGMIVVGSDGKRFMDEKYRNSHGKMKVAGQWVQAPAPCPMFMVFDQVLFSGGILYDKNLYHSWNPLLKVYDWSNDNSAELARGWIKRADTIAELSRTLEIDSAALEETIRAWNAHCAEGRDPYFGRKRMLSPIDHPPFYAVEISPAFVNTQGGPRRNARGQIVRPDGAPIKRLYSAGELGSIYGYLYQGGGNLGECMAFGRISGRNAVAEKPWS